MDQADDSAVVDAVAESPQGRVESHRARVDYDVVEDFALPTGDGGHTHSGPYVLGAEDRMGRYEVAAGVVQVNGLAF